MVISEVRDYINIFNTYLESEKQDRVKVIMAGWVLWKYILKQNLGSKVCRNPQPTHQGVLQCG